MERKRTAARGRAKLLGDTAHGEAVVPVVVVLGVNARGCEVQVVSVVAIVDRTRPIVRVAACIVNGAAVDVAGPRATAGLRRSLNRRLILR